MRHRYSRPWWGAGVIVALLTAACALQKRIHQLREDQRQAPETQLAYLGNHMVEQRTEAPSPCATINKEMAALLDEHALELERRVPKPSHLMLLPRDDGFGAQLHGVMAALAYTKGENMVYVRTPWRHVAHGPPNIPAEEWAWRLESFAGVAMAELTYSSGLGLIPAIANVHSLVEQDVNRYYTASVLELLRSRYATALSGRQAQLARVFAGSRQNSSGCSCPARGCRWRRRREGTIHEQRCHPGPHALGVCKHSRTGNQRFLASYVSHLLRGGRR